VTRVYDDPAAFAEDQLAGFVDLYADRLTAVPGGVVSFRTAEPQVAVVIGGGSGHYPAFCGTVGPGLAAGAVVGNIFTSPSAAHAYSVARAADQGRGVIFSFGNYAGDVLNFGLAAERLRADGVDTRIVVVTDDIASAVERAQRRGIAGDFSVFKIMGAAAAEGRDLDEVERVGQHANDQTRTLGVAFSGCTLPGAAGPLFTVPEGHLGLGLGIHGEAGIRDVAMLDASGLADLLVSKVLAAAPARTPQRVAPLLNGLGNTKYEELFVLWGRVAARLRGAGLELIEPEVGELVTSLDMGGCSLTLTWLDDELERLWRADAYTPGYRKQSATVVALRAPRVAGKTDERSISAPAATPAAVALAEQVRAALAAMRCALVEHEVELGRIDTVAGDGDHGRGMVKGVTAAVASAAADADAGAGWVLRRAGRAWAEAAGGTSGVLWGAALEAMGRTLGDGAETYPDDRIVAGARAFADAITGLGGAQLGDKTLVDSLLPFVAELERRVDAGERLRDAWPIAAKVARAAADATAHLRPRVGRARPLAERSVGTPDAGAMSMALVVEAIGGTILGSG
jgi:dihydroxyacetone kinase